MYYTKGVAIGTKVSVSYRKSGRLSGVVIKRGSTVIKMLELTSAYKTRYVAVRNRLTLYIIHSCTFSTKEHVYQFAC